MLLLLGFPSRRSARARQKQEQQNCQKVCVSTGLMCARAHHKVHITIFGGCALAEASLSSPIPMWCLETANHCRRLVPKILQLFSKLQYLHQRGLSAQSVARAQSTKKDCSVTVHKSINQLGPLGVGTAYMHLCPRSQCVCTAVWRDESNESRSAEQ